MSSEAYNAYYLGVQIGIARVKASTGDHEAWQSVSRAKENAKTLAAARLLAPGTLHTLLSIGDSKETPRDLHDFLVGFTDNLGAMWKPYGDIYYLGFWVGIAEGQAACNGSEPHKQAAANEALKCAAALRQLGYRISPDEISPSSNYGAIEHCRKYWGEIFRKSAEESSMTQSDWRWCKKCQGLFFAGGQGMGVCKAGGHHDMSGSRNYRLIHNQPTAAGQSDWRWCKKCQGLFFAGGKNMGRCPDGGNHDMSYSGNFTLINDEPTAVGQSNWRWCKNCQGLFFAGHNKGICPAGGGHDMSDSGDYTL